MTRDDIITHRLIIKIQEERADGFNALYTKYGAILYGIILNIIKDEQAAKNLLGRCFVYICTNIDEYNEPCMFFTWLIRIARSISIEGTKPAPTSLQNHKDALQMIFLGGYTYTKVAEIMNIPVAEVKKAVRNCLLSK